MSEQDLTRGLGFKETFALVVGTVIGTGVFLKASIMTQQTGGMMWVLAAWAAAGLLSLAGALCYSELGSRFPHAGGEYVYLREAFGPLPAFLNGWTLFWIGNPGSIASYSVGLITFLGGALALGPHMQTAAAIAVIVTLTAINCVTVKAAGSLQALMTAVKILLIFGLTVAILGHLPSSESVAGATGSAPWPGWRAFGAAMLGALWAYDGWNGMPMAAGEVKNPQKNIPRALIFGMLSITFIYLTMNAAFFLALPISEIVSANSPQFPAALPVASKAILATAGVGALGLVSIVMAFSAFVSLNGSVLSGARVPFAMARDGLLWAQLGRVHPKTHAPISAVLAQGAIAIGLACSGTFDQLTNYVMFASWIFYSMSVLALFKLRRRKTQGGFRVPGYPVIPIIFLMVSSWLVINTVVTSPVESLIGLGFILAGVPVYFSFLKKRPKIQRVT